MTTQIDYSQLPDIEINERLAKLMGWEKEKDWHGEYWTEGNGIFARPTIYASYCSHWNPCEDLNQMRLVEDRLIELGLIDGYLFVLKLNAMSGQPSRVDMDWSMCHATARQKAEAALMAWEKVK